MQKIQTNFRIDKETKEEAFEILKRIGISPTEAVNMYMRHIVLYKELPFKPAIPNDETLDTFYKTDNGQELNHYSSIDDIFDNLKR